MNKRFIYIDNNQATDWTPELSNYKIGSKSMPFVAGQHSLLIGSRLPFNHFYVKLAISNNHITSTNLQYWGDSGWVDCVELIDETSALSNSGFMTFTPNRQLPWKMQEESNSIPELSQVTIYDYYWIKINFNHDLNVNTAIDWIGNIFSDDNDLSAEYPDLTKASVLTSFQAGKTNWQEQAVKAAEIIESDLINRGIISGNENILNRDFYKNASVAKTAEIIFGAFGDDFADQRTIAREEYKLRLVKKLAISDKNNNAIEDVFERKTVTGFLSR